jgi:hypothetical protein
MKSLNSHLENAISYLLYDLSLPIEERPIKAVFFKTGIDLANYLGINSTRLPYVRVPGKKVTGKDGKIYAVRIAPDKKK